MIWTGSDYDIAKMEATEWLAKLKEDTAAISVRSALDSLRALDELRGTEDQDVLETEAYDRGWKEALETWLERNP